MSVSYRVGDIAKIRDWDDMVREFGEPDSDGDIKIVTSYKDGNTIRSYRTWFLEEMRRYCGRVATVYETYVVSESLKEYGLLLTGTDNSDIGEYAFISEMLIPFDSLSSAPDVKIQFEEIFGQIQKEGMI